MHVDPPVMPPQLDTVTLAEAMARTNNWKESMKYLYGDDLNKMPHGFYIPIEDIMELAKLPEYYKEYAITGVRAYLTFHRPQPNHPPYTDAITAVLVPVQRLLIVDKVSNIQYGIDKDLILPVTPPDKEGRSIDTEEVSIYDVTMPCPQICDPTSDLY